ncbi:carboxymuconolactone decarboxylase family protein [Phaeobacter gallaeciensis]|uniref:Carboxymuconolactone decarboxylase family protein n=2 Tax=Roseobacteraceae TaxID=2854170 RepID=A0A366WMW6_9RHOB|nr:MULTISPECIES: carboxymuconolactone decarboxylase family protein [Roseobacteraceae]MBT3143006.1 carboxymuconolactone decarboxylase family protein [Falsiruegeria litorea]MBT8166889.1 carboxymuconolactone decarboxylase family protein [Falsiruegeria litorea]RBW51538.1 carboxymuconolactone decarboxylase family protein [Phaeobacter gallaeciensis]
MSEALKKGRALVANMNPGLETALAERYDAAVPDMAETLVEWAYGRHYAREGVDLKTRQLCTIAALTALGGHTAPQLKVNIDHTLAAGASEREILEIIWQMSVYGGMPAAINGLNAAMDRFQELKR